MTYRLNGRATQAEEQSFKSIKYLMGDEEITPKKKYKELKALFDEHGPSAFDKEQTQLFDNLNAEYGGCSIDSKADSASAQIKSYLASSNLDKRGVSDRTESARYLREAVSRLGADVTVLGDGVTLRKARIDVTKTPLCDQVSLHATYRKKLIWCDAVSAISKPDSSDFISGGRRYRTRTHTIYRKKLIWYYTAGLDTGDLDTVALADPENLRAVLECYRVEYPEKDYPEHTLWPRKPRNESPTRKKNAGPVNAFLEYFELNKSFEPLQTNYLRADNENFGYDSDGEEGDAKITLRSPDAELENRPTINELVALYSAPTVKFKTRTVSYGGDIECMVKFTTQNRKGKLERQKLVNIGDLKKGDSWTLHRIGGLHFAPCRTKYHWRGQLTHYQDKHGIWHPVKEDVYGTPKGPKDIAKSMGSDEKYGKPLHPRTSKSNMKKLSPAERTKQLANKPKPLSCPMTADEALEVFRLKLQANGKPANNDNVHYDGLPYDVKSADELQFGHTFGTKSAETHGPEPFDDGDVVERKDFLEAVNARLSPQARRVANMIVHTEETETLAQNQTDIGAALWTGRRKASASTLKRHGRIANDNAEAEIRNVLQELAA